MSDLTHIEKKKREVRFSASVLTSHDSVERDRHFSEIDAYVSGLLPFEVDLDYATPTPRRSRHDKEVLRRWLNKHCEGTWTFTLMGVAFSEQRDGVFFKIFWK